MQHLPPSQYTEDGKRLLPHFPPRAIFKRAVLGEFAVYPLVLAAGYHDPEPKG